MSALTIYKIFAVAMGLGLFALYWLLRSASARVKKEIQDLTSEDDADPHVGGETAGGRKLAR